MNCLEFRRRLGAEPDCRDTDFVTHRESCENCAAAAIRAGEFERELRRAVLLPVPEGLNARIAVRQSFAPRRAVVGWRTGLSLAASLLVAFGLGVLLPPLLTSNSLSGDIEQHVLAIPHPLPAEGHVGDATVAVMLEALGMRTDQPIGDVRAASICAVRDRTVAHFILQGQLGPLDVVVIPGEQLASRQTLSGPGLSGVMVPVQGGALALLGAPGEPLEALERGLEHSVGRKL